MLSHAIVPNFVKAGEDACKRLAALLPDSVSVTRIQPCMKDWNDVLVHRAEISNHNYFKSIVLKEPSKPETVKIIRMSDVELTPVEWLWKPYLPFGKLSVLQGNPGEGIVSGNGDEYFFPPV